MHKFCAIQYLSVWPKFNYAVHNSLQNRMNHQIFQELSQGEASIMSHNMRFLPHFTALTRWFYHPFLLAKISTNYHSRLRIESNYLPNSLFHLVGCENKLCEYSWSKKPLKLGKMVGPLKRLCWKSTPGFISCYRQPIYVQDADGKVSSIG